MQLAHHPGVVLAQAAAPVDQQAQHLQGLVVGDGAQPAHADADQGDGVGVGVVGLAALAGGEDPHPRGQLGRHVQDLLTQRQEAGHDVPADALAALDRPGPLGPTVRVLHQGGEPGLVGGEPAVPDDLLGRCHDLDRDRALVRVHPDHHRTRCLLVHELPPSRRDLLCRSGGHRYYQQSKPFFSLSRPCRWPGQRTPIESHTTRVDSRKRATTPTTWTEPGRAPILRSIELVAA